MENKREIIIHGEKFVINLSNYEISNAHGYNIFSWSYEHNHCITAIIEVNQRCNFRCRHCYCIDRISDGLSTTQFKQIIDKFIATDCLYFYLSGGEIFLRYDFVELYTYIIEKGGIVNINTNGSVNIAPFISILKKRKPYQLNVTMYGTCEAEYYQLTNERGMFKCVMDNLQLLFDNDIKFHIKVMATKSNKESIENARFERIALAFNTDLEYGTFILSKLDHCKDSLCERIPAKELVLLEDTIKTHRDKWKKEVDKNKQKTEYICSGGKNSIFIDGKGNCFICAIYRKEGCNILSNSFSAVWHYIREEHNDMEKIYYDSKCYMCPDNGLCRWCPGYAWLEEKNLTSKIDYLCALVAERKMYYESKKY